MSVSSIGFSFAGFQAQSGTLAERGLRVFGPNATLAQDLEPEYIAVSSDSKRAWVTLQENNAIAILDLQKGEVERLVPLGFKDHAQAGHGLDASDRDGAANIQTRPVFGMYQPDSIASFEVNGETYLITANEGDAREYGSFVEEARVKSLKLDPTAFPNAADLQQDAQIGRLNVTNTLGDTDGDGDFDRLYAFGGRSISVWSADGQLVYDSGDLIERQIAQLMPHAFNADSVNNTRDSRSDNKGPEPEGVTVGVVNGKPFAFVGLERMSGVMVFDLSDPRSPRFVQYLNNRDFSKDPATQVAEAGDLAPEGVLFVPAGDSPDGRAMLIVGNEVSGSTTLYGVANDGQLTQLGTYRGNVFNKGASEIPAYDPRSKRIFYVNGATGQLDVLDAADPTRPTLINRIDLAPYGGSANSVSVKDGLVVAAVQNDANKQANGKAVFFDVDGNLKGQVDVGALPDMITFTPDGKFVLVANEGEPSVDYTHDPEGSVSMIDVSKVIKGK